MIKIISYPFLFIAVALVCLSCRRNMSEEAMVKYITNPRHNLLIEKQFAGYSYRLQLKPSDMFAWQEVSAMDSMDKKKSKEIFEQYNKQLYFILSISNNDQDVLNGFRNNRQTYGQMITELDFELAGKVTLCTPKGDTITMVGYHYPRTYGASPSTDILFSFEKPQINKLDYLFFELKEFGLKTGDIRFKITKKQLKKVYNLHISD